MRSGDEFRKLLQIGLGQARPRVSGNTWMRVPRIENRWTQTVLPSAETAAMLFWSLLAAGQITMRKSRRLAELRIPFFLNAP